MATALSTLHPPSLETDSDSENLHFFPLYSTVAKVNICNTVCTVYPLVLDGLLKHLAFLLCIDGPAV